MDNILKFFIKEPEKEFHIRQLSKLTKKSPTTISKYLKGFERKGILISEQKLNHLLFKANIENIKFKQLKLNYNLNILFDSKLIEFLVGEFNYPEAIILFGSFSKAENTSKSDIDLLIISPIKKEINLEKYEKHIGNKIQLFVHSKKEIEQMMEKNKELFNNLVNGNTIYGFWEVLK